MDAFVTYLDPHTEVPQRMPSPFAPGPPCGIAQRAVDVMRAQLPAELARGLEAPGGGKMFGVLVVADRDGRVGFLRAFSGMVGRSWHVPGFVPPAFDETARDAFWIAGEAELDEIAAQMAELDAKIAVVRSDLAALAARHAGEANALSAVHERARELRHAARATGGDLRELDRESRVHSVEKRDQDRAQRAARQPLEAELAALENQHRALDEQRAAKSRGFLIRIHDTYALPNARGEEKVLRELFAPAEPPGGAGDCAAPKLLAYAYRHALRPLALAEIWLGAPPATGDRRSGMFYPACRGKCGPILGHMLEGLDVDAAPVFGGGPIAEAEPIALLEDRWLVVVDKPVGLLSVPGRGGALRDSVLARLRSRYPDATGPIVVHRLDLDTSGVLLAAKDADTHRELQKLFATRQVQKRYVAWLDGELPSERGTISLPLRVDLDDRPRQIVDPIHGKEAVTDWQVLARQSGRTRVALSPRTGRAHQLRVHAAVGLGAPVVGDRLYGRPDTRLMLHAEAITFVHPHTGESVTATRPAPF